MATPKDKELEKLTALIMALGGKEPLGEVEIIRAGDQITLPPGMEIPEAIKWLERQDKAENTKVTFQEPIDGFPLDAARAVGLAVKELFGFKGIADFWPQSIGLGIDAEGNTDQVYIGAFELPNIEGKIFLEQSDAMQLMVSATVKQKHQPKIKELVTLARQKLRSHSVYRGGAFKLVYDPRTGYPDPPKFIRTGTLGQLQLNQDTREILQAAVWTPIQRTERCRAENVPLKRGILLEGPYGTGKSLFATETATVTRQHGWTFIYLDDVRWLAKAYTFAQFYAPAVLFAEDIDTVISDGELPENIRNVIDAVNTKNSDIIMVLTTNHAERLPKSILRPGRLDAVIPFRAPDAYTVEVLLRQYSGNLLPDDSDLREVGRKLAGRIPAVIREVVERSKLQMIQRDAEQLEPRDLLLAADSMAHHLALQEAEVEQPDSVSELFGRGFGQGIGGMLERHLAAMMVNAKDREWADSELVEQVTGNNH